MDSYQNRELSWIQFNHRVIDEAVNINNPLSERLRFLSISASNLDEYINVRLSRVINLSDEELLAILLPEIQQCIDRQSEVLDSLIKEDKVDISGLRCPENNDDAPIDYLNGNTKILYNCDLPIEEIATDIDGYSEQIRNRGSDKIAAIITSSKQDFDVEERFIFKSKYAFELNVLRQVANEINENYEPFESRFPERVNDHGGDYFKAIKIKDILVHHPYETFDVVSDFLNQAAMDPNVTEIYQTLYRTSEDSPIALALIKAAEMGKKVVCFIEIKARFDEENNIKLVNQMSNKGVRVHYNVENFKTHAKLSLVKREVNNHTERYSHFGTGNYHPLTAKVYTDLSYFTSNKQLCKDAEDLFNYISGESSSVPEFRQLLVAPHSLKKSILELIEDEKNHAIAGRPASIWLKMNSLIDRDIIDALYSASKVGVKIKGIIRGACSIRAGVEGLSENIEIKSIVGRFLEHSRIFCFGCGHPMPSSRNKVYISSADFMPRNMEKRIEIATPILNSTVHEQILGQVMWANFEDTAQSWNLEDNEYKRVSNEGFSAHEFFLSNPSLSGRGSAMYGEFVDEDVDNYMNEERNIAVIDIGSNSVRLVIYDALKRVPLPILNEKNMCGLGKGLEATGRLNKEGKLLALDTLGRFSHIIDKSRVSNVHCIATSAVRDAEDGAEFMREVKRRYNIDIQLLSGEEESRLGCLSIISAGFKKNGIVADLGGGSLELGELNFDEEPTNARDMIKRLISLPLGTIRATKLDKDEADKYLVQANVGKLLEDKILYAIGGSFRNLAKVHMARIKYPIDIVQCYECDAKDLLETCEYIIKKPDSVDAYGVAEERKISIPFAAKLMKLLIEKGKPSTIAFSTYGVREGVLFDLLDRQTKKLSALISGAIDMARQLTPSTLTQEMQDEWVRFGFELSHFLSSILGNVFDKKVLDVACILSRIGWHEVRPYRAETAYRLILNSPLTELTHKERVVIAGSVFYRYIKPSAKTAQRDLKRMLGKADFETCQLVGRVMRTGYKLSGGVLGVLPRTHATVDKDKQVLSFNFHPNDRVMISEDFISSANKLAKLMSLRLELN